MKENKKSNIYDKFESVASLAVILLGIGAFGYGIISAISNSVKNHRETRSEKTQAAADTISFNTAARMQQKSR